MSLGTTHCRPTAWRGKSREWEGEARATTSIGSASASVFDVSVYVLSSRVQAGLLVGMLAMTCLTSLF